MASAVFNNFVAASAPICVYFAALLGFAVTVDGKLVGLVGSIWIILRLGNCCASSMLRLCLLRLESFHMDGVLPRQDGLGMIKRAGIAKGR